MSYFLDISIYQIQLFITAAEFKSFTSAASHLKTTQSAVSKSIAAMESILGFRLFIRSRSQLKLTAPGEFLYGQWRHLLVNIESSLDKANELYQRGMQTLVVGVPDSLENGGEEIYLQRFQSIYPTVQISYHVIPANQLVPRLQSGELDLVITGLYESKALERLGFQWKNYVNVPDIAIMHRSNPLAQRAEISMQDLKNERFLMLSPSENASYFERIYLLCKEYGFQPNVPAFSPNFHSMITNLIRNRQGIIISNRFLHHADHPDLCSYELHGTNAGLIVAWNRDKAGKYLQKLVNLFPECCAPGLL